MSESTAPEIMAAVPAAAPAKTLERGVGSSIQSVTIFSFSEVSKPSFHIDSFEPEDVASVFAGPTIGKNESVPDELSDPIRETTGIPLNPFEIANKVESFFNQADEPSPEPGVLPTPEEAVATVTLLLDNAPLKDANIKQDKLEVKTLSERIKNAKALDHASFTKHIEKTIQNEVIAPTSSNFKTIEAVQNEEAIVQNPEITQAVKTILIDAPHASATVKALLEVGIKTAPEIVGQALTNNLIKEKIEAKVSVKPKTAPFFSLNKQIDFTFELEFKEKDKKIPQKIYVVDTDAQEAQIQALDTAVDSVFDANENGAAGKDVLGEYNKQQRHKSEPLEGSLRDDGALGESTQTIYGIDKNTNKKTLKKYIQDILHIKPPIREDTRGEKVSDQDVERVFNNTPVIDSSSLAVKKNG